MSEKQEPTNRTIKTIATAIVSLVLGCTGGASLTPLVTSYDMVRKDDLREALAPIVSQLSDIQKDIATLKAEAAVTRYEREQRAARL